MKIGLVLIDIQNDFFKGGKFELVKPELAAAEARKLLDFFREKGWPVYHVNHIDENPDAAFFIKGSVGSQSYKECEPLPNEDRIIKHRPSGFLNTNLKQRLDEDGVDTLLVGGMMTHMCVDTTVRAARDLGFQVELAEDACATRDLQWGETIITAENVHCAYMAALNGIFANISTVDAWIEQHKADA